MTTSEASTETIGRQAKRGLKWSLVGTFVNKVGSFAMGLVLARLLTPEDYGVYAVALSAMFFVMHVNDVGLIAATTQWRGKIEEMAPTATSLALVFSIVTYIGFWFAAPALANLSHVPAATNVIRVLTIVILVDGVTAVRSGTLMREFRQDKLIQANMVGLVVNAAVAISMAALGGGPMSFAAGMVAGSIVTGFMVFTGAGVPFQLGFERPIARRLMAFGIPLAASLGIESILLNTDYVVVGHVVGAGPLGEYLLAFNISTWALSVVSSAIRYVSVAGFSRLSEVDAETLSAGVRRSLPMLFTVLVPIVVLSASLAYPLIQVLYGENWTPAAVVLPYLMILTAVRVLTSFAMDILMGAGATKWTLWFNLAWAVALVPALIYGTNVGGTRGTAIAHAVVGLVVAVPVMAWALHSIGVRLAPLGPPLLRPLLAGLASAAVTLLIGHAVGGSIPLLKLAGAGAAGLVVYGALALPREQLRQWLGKLRREEAADVAVE
ncbi:oligosaccharide flippase family protein [Dactylosporangium sp. NPDC048998]|uniref:oligosaccharide flippase family protein n=1 Tax=Dactylosporangium sp. NPDC048998 TaxID=3363976 RepID=UPI0037105CA4